MRVRRTLKDGRILDFGGKNRYACFRLTQFGAYTTMSSNQSAETVEKALRSWTLFGFKTAVLDSHTGEIIASYPTLPDSQTDG